MPKFFALVVVLAGVYCLLPSASGDEKPSFEEKVAVSQPLEFEPVVRKHGAVLRVEYLLMDKPFLAEFFANGPESLSIKDGKLTAKFKDAVHRLKLPEQKGGKLVHDAGFGEAGVMPYDPKQGWQPEETLDKWGSRVASRPLGDGLVGHIENKPFYQLKIKDADGKEVVSLGKEEGDEKICSLKNFCRWKDLVFVVDANCRDIMVWTIKGRFLFEIEARELGLDYPWLMSIDITDAGEMYLGFTQTRKRKDNGRAKSEITESAFLKITGLDTIKPENIKHDEK